MSITVIIIIITVLISISAFSNQKIINDLIFEPAAITNRNQWYRFFSCALIHADAIHLAFNMISFYSFGEMLEAYFKQIFGSLGPLLFIALYVISQFLCLLPTYSKNKDNYYYRSLGASGAVSAVIFAFIFLDPLRKMGIFPIPFYFPGFIFGAIYLAITYFLDKRGGSAINHSAHFFGAITGIMLVIVFGYLFSPVDLLQNFIRQIRNF